MDFWTGWQFELRFRGLGVAFRPTPRNPVTPPGQTMTDEVLTIRGIVALQAALIDGAVTGQVDEGAAAT
jgi:hypothetical protein